MKSIILTIALTAILSANPPREQVKAYVSGLVAFYDHPEINTENIMAIIQIESTCRQFDGTNLLVSSAGASGIMQIMPTCFEYAKEYNP